MPPRLYSRYSFCASFIDPVTGNLILTDRQKFAYVDLQDNLTYIVQAGDTLQSIAAKVYASLPRPDGLWWIVADFQQPPIFDPTIALVAGTVLVLPSLKTVTGDIFSAARQAEATQ